MREKIINEYSNSKFKTLTSDSRGITLIALVVTIVVLLILAGVTINLVLSDGGLFSRAQDAQNKQKESEIRDQIGLLLADYQVEKYTRGTDLKTYLEGKEGTIIDSVTENGNNLEVEIDGYKVTINGATLDIGGISKDGETGGSGSGGGQTSGPTDIAVTSITMNKETTTILLGATETLSISSIEPSNATNQTVTWSSNLRDIAEVSQTGVVTAKKVGTATITATANGGENVTASCSVTVEPVTVADMVEIPEALSTNTYTVDKYGNPIVIPAGFTVVAHGTDYVEYTYDKENGTSTNTPVVQDGIVIKHAEDGNQFVWVPIGEIKNDAVENTSNKTNIKLGRYSNFGTGANATPAQEARKDIPDNEPPVPISTYYFEISSNFPGGTYSGTTYKKASEYGNTQATNLTEWINGALDNGGYYIARYEASYDGEEKKALSQQSLSASTSRPSTKGDLWNRVTQQKASEVSKAMYERTDSSLYYSDLINGYAWDTALIFIQAYSGQTSYAAQGSKITGDSPDISGERTNGKDKVCNIYDMASNVIEWSTETSSYSDNSSCVGRGSYFGDSSIPASGYAYASVSYSRNGDIGFRPVLCVQ